MTQDTAPDRRAARSRDLLLAALPALMAERGFERLTTQNIIDRAGVGRATFYAHFDNKEELLAASVGRLRGWLEAMRRPACEPPFAFMLAFFDHLDSHRAIYRTTFERDSEVTVERLIRAMLGDVVRQELVIRRGERGAGGGDDADIDLATQFVVATFWSVAVWWLGGGVPRTPAQINAIFLSLARPGLDLAAGP